VSIISIDCLENTKLKATYFRLLCEFLGFIFLGINVERPLEVMSYELFLLSSHSKLGVFLSDLHQCCEDHWLNNVPLYCWAHRLCHGFRDG
jgi:hypothetical protein